jgi:hypothetical protein
VDWDGRADGEGVLLMPSPYNEGSYRELEARLTDLREQHRQLWWHVNQRYRFGESRVILATVIRRKGGAQFSLPPRTELVAGGPSVGSRLAVCRVYQWSERVRPDLVVEGVDVLTRSMHDGRADRIWLPSTVYDRVMGKQLVAA